jgi:hypothetical protein
MTHPKHRLRPLAVAMTVAVASLAACQERKPTEMNTPAASSGEYPTPAEAAPSSTSGTGTGAAASSDGSVDKNKK